MSLDLLLLFIPTIASVSLTPGLCMTLAFTLGLSVGYSRTLWMMCGELAGVAAVFLTTFWGLGWFLAQDPLVFKGVSLVGGVYLLILAYRLLLQSPGALRQQGLTTTRPIALAGLGFATAVSNPKGWAFLVALLPGFIVPEAPFLSQGATMLGIMLTTEFLSMTLYASGGQWLATRFTDASGFVMANRIAATMLGAAALWVLAGVGS